MSSKYHNDSACVHFLTFSCYNHLWLFKSPELYREFLRSLDNARNKHHFLVLGYVLMPNHVHLMLWLPDGITISNVLRAIKQPFSNRALKLLEKQFPEIHAKVKITVDGKSIRRFWQAGGGFDRNISDPDQIRNTIEYMHGNPVRRGLVDKPTDWRWSSVHCWEDGSDMPLKIDRPDWLMV